MNENYEQNKNQPKTSEKWTGIGLAIAGFLVVMMHYDTPPEVQKIQDDLNKPKQKFRIHRDEAGKPHIDVISLQQSDSLDVLKHKKQEKLYQIFDADITEELLEEGGGYTSPQATERAIQSDK